MKSKVAIVVSSIIERVELVFGGFWVFIIAFGMITDPPKDIAVCVVVIIMGVFGLGAFIDGLKRRKLRINFKKCVAYLSAEPTGKLTGLASATGMTVDSVKKNIAKMIYKGFFAHAYIDEAKDCLIVREKENNTYGDAGEPVALIPCQCRNCGGVSKIIKGTPSQCDFCGSILKG